MSDISQEGPAATLTTSDSFARNLFLGFASIQEDVVTWVHVVEATRQSLNAERHKSLSHLIKFSKLHTPKLKCTHKYNLDTYTQHT